MTLRNILLAGTALGAAALLAGPAMAGSAAATQNDINTMKEQIQALQQRLDDLQISQGNELKEIKEKQDAVQIDFKDGKPTFRTGDGLFTMSIRGRAHLDMASYNLDAADTAHLAAMGGGDKGLSSGANFRRGELGVEGTFMRDFGYKANFQWGNSGIEGYARIKDLYLTYSGIKPITLWAGAIQTPMTLDDSTSSNDITFIERAAAANLATGIAAGDGRLSWGVTAATSNLYGSVFYTGDTVGDGSTSARTSNSKSAVVSRFAFAFQPNDKSNVHVGASGTYSFDPNTTSFSFSERPELRVDKTSIINTGAINSPVDSAYAVGPELAANYGPVKVQGEYYFYGVNRKNSALPDPRFDAWYVQASWVLTGEQYKYAMDPAAYKGVKPSSPFTFGGGIGAWELAARYSQADLNFHDDRTAGNGGVAGGLQDVITVGLNWYMNNNVRLMFEYQDVSIDKRSSAGGAKNSLDYNAIASRLQFNF